MKPPIHGSVGETYENLRGANETYRFFHYSPFSDGEIFAAKPAEIEPWPSLVRPKILLRWIAYAAEIQVIGTTEDFDVRNDLSPREREHLESNLFLIDAEAEAGGLGHSGFVLGRDNVNNDVVMMSRCGYVLGTTLFEKLKSGINCIACLSGIGG